MTDKTKSSRLPLILGVIAVCVIALGFFIHTRPDEFRVERTVVIAAAPSEIFPWINEPARGNEWMPWASTDPQAVHQYEGGQSGVGAKVSWDGKKIGSGSSTITESIPNEKVVTRLDFVKPMQGTSTSEITLTPVEGGTEVKWAMYGVNNFMAKAVSIVMNCEKMLGPQFEEGLANLKGKVEAR